MWLTGSQVFARLVHRVLRPLDLQLSRRPRRGPDVPLTPAQVDACRLVAHRDALLATLAPAARVIEVGVLAGDFTARLLTTLTPATLALVDTFEADDGAYHNGRAQRFTPATHEAFIAERFQAERARGQVTLHRGLSWDVLASFPAASADLIYLDADHSEPAVRRDLAAAHRVLAPGGWIVCNDYTDRDHPAWGVMPALHAFCHAEGYRLGVFALHPRGYYDVAVTQKR